jgi:hypothetical protein
VAWRESSWRAASRASEVVSHFADSPATGFERSCTPVASDGACISRSVSTDCCAARLYAGASTVVAIAIVASRSTISDRPGRYRMPRSATIQPLTINLPTGTGVVALPRPSSTHARHTLSRTGDVVARRSIPSGNASAHQVEGRTGSTQSGAKRAAPLLSTVDAASADLTPRTWSGGSRLR